MSLTGTRDFALVNRGTKSQVLPTVNWGGKKFGVPHVYIRQQGAVYQQSLPERLQVM